MQAFPRHPVDVAIVGGGITGCAAAWYLANEGVSVVLLEAGELNGQASGANAGSLHAQIPQDTYLELGDRWAAGFAPTLKLLRVSIGLWSEADRAFHGALEVRVNGGLMLASSAAEMRMVERKADFERAAGTAIEILDADALRALAPYVSGELAGAAYCPAEGKASPLHAAPAFARGAQAAGAAVFRRRALTAVESCTSGYRLHCNDDYLTARRVILATGAATPEVAALFGIEAPSMQSVPIQVCVTEPVQPFIDHLLYYARAPLTMKQTAIGTILIGGGWPARLDAQNRPVPDPRSLSQNLGLALEVVPQLADLTVMRSWAARVNGTPDWQPVIGELPRAPGVYLAYVPWMGFTGGPAAARIVASLVQGREPELDLPLAAFAPRH